MPFNEAMSMFCHAGGTDPVSLWDSIQRRRQAEHMAAFITMITKNDLLLMMASIAQFTLECENVVWHSYVLGTVCNVSFPLRAAFGSCFCARGIRAMHAMCLRLTESQSAEAYPSDWLAGLLRECALLWDGGKAHDRIENVCGFLGIIAVVSRVVHVRLTMHSICILCSTLVVLFVCQQMFLIHLPKGVGCVVGFVIQLQGEKVLLLHCTAGRQLRTSCLPAKCAPPLSSLFSESQRHILLFFGLC